MVIDASVAASWFLTTQANALTDALLDNPGGHVFVAPIFFSVELRNVLLLGERRGTITRIEAEEKALLAAALITIEHGDIDAEAERAWSVARRSGLKLYDAIYLEKALREHRPLASRDGRLIEAARGLGVDTHDLRTPSA